MKNSFGCKWFNFGHHGFHFNEGGRWIVFSIFKKEFRPLWVHVYLFGWRKTFRR